MLLLLQTQSFYGVPYSSLTGNRKKMKMQKLSIVIPAYNEEKRIGNTLKAYSNYFESLRKQKKLDYEIVVVINNTTDNTEDVVRKYQKKNKRILCLNLKAKGKGYAVIEGFKDSLKRKNDMIGFVDADMSTKPAQFYELAENIRNNDGIIASRYVKGAIIRPRRTIMRVLTAEGFSFLVRTMFLMPYKDTQCGAKLFNRKLAEYLSKNVGMTRWAFDVELLYKARKAGFTIKEQPTIWTEHEGTKMNVTKTSLQMFLAIARLRLIYSPFVKLQRPLRPFVGWLWRAVQNA